MKSERVPCFFCNRKRAWRDKRWDCDMSKFLNVKTCTACRSSTFRMFHEITPEVTREKELYDQISNELMDQLHAVAWLKKLNLFLHKTIIKAERETI